MYFCEMKSGERKWRGQVLRTPGNRGVEGEDIFPVGAKPADNRLLPACQIFFIWVLPWKK